MQQVRDCKQAAAPCITRLQSGASSSVSSSRSTDLYVDDVVCILWVVCAQVLQHSQLHLGLMVEALLVADHLRWSGKQRHKSFSALLKGSS